MSEELYHENFNVSGGDFNNAGKVSTDIKSILSELGIDPQVIRRAVIASFEAEMNMVMYAEEGILTLKLMQDYINIICKDRGQGIKDIDQAMQEGFSTATPEMREQGFGAGMGLPNIKKNADVFHIESEVGVGTTLDLRFNF